MGCAAAARVERLLEEVRTDVVVQVGEGQRVPRAGVDMVEDRPADLWPGGTHRKGGVDDHVARHDVDHRVRRGRQLGHVALAVRQDDRVGHLEALDPPGVRILQRGLHDRGPHHRDHDPTAHVGDDALPEGLGEGVAVRPAERAGPFGAGLHQLVVHPVAAALLGVAGGGEVTGLAVHPLGLAAQPGEPLGRTRLELDGLLELEPPPGLGVVVDVVDVLGLGDHPAATARGVRGGHVHVVRHLRQGAVLGGNRGQHRIHQRAGADGVGGERLVDRRVEGDVTGAVQHHVQVARQRGDVRQVALDHLDPGVDELGLAAGRCDQGPEDRLADQGDHPVTGRGGALAADQDGRGGVGQLGEDLPEQLLPDEAGRTGHHDLLARQQVTQAPAQRRRPDDLRGVGGNRQRVSPTARGRPRCCG
ncbi:hypothetical protein SDC9_64528 [bioreactor metagenome]|uniref:Uncharacterized protein n=1 Tax=bioreactor metagenome TaxID=1076179 RepID=A0A644XPI9_9ZZZZ